MPNEPEPAAGGGEPAEILPLEGDWEVWGGGEGDPHSLADLINRVLDRGVVITGDITISVAGVDLVYLGLSAVLTSVSTARRALNRPVAEP